MAIERINESLCTGCGICVDTCPMDVIRLDKVKEKAFIKYPGDCTVCYFCEMDCPVGAIYVSPMASRKVLVPY